MPISALKLFANDWQRAAEHARPPRLSDISISRAWSEHPGFAIIGRCPPPTLRPSTRSTPMFQVLAAGPDHHRFGGHIMAGHRLDEMVDPARLPMLLDIYQTVSQHATVHSWQCINMARNAPPKHYTRVIGAIADDVGDGRCLCGVWVWHESPDLVSAKEGVAASAANGDLHRPAIGPDNLAI